MKTNTPYATKENQVESQYIPVREAAKVVNVPLGSMYRLIASGAIPGVCKLGPRTVRINASQFASWVESGGLGGRCINENVVVPS